MIDPGPNHHHPHRNPIGTNHTTMNVVSDRSGTRRYLNVVPDRLVTRRPGRMRFVPTASEHVASDRSGTRRHLNVVPDRLVARRPGRMRFVPAASGTRYIQSTYGAPTHPVGTNRIRPGNRSQQGIGLADRLWPIV